MTVSKAWMEGTSPGHDVESLLINTKVKHSG